MGINIDDRGGAATKQAANDRDELGRFKTDNVPKTGFHTNPEHRSNGSWKKADTPRFKLEQMMMLTEAELSTMYGNPNTPLFERKLAIAIIDGTWPVIRDMINEVYGRPKETVDFNDQSNYPPIIRGFVLPTAPEDFIDKDIMEQFGEDDGRRILERATGRTNFG